MSPRRNLKASPGEVEPQPYSGKAKVTLYSYSGRTQFKITAELDPAELACAIRELRGALRKIRDHLNECVANAEGQL